MQFEPNGANIAQHGLIFQWQNGQFVQVLARNAARTSQSLASKPQWGRADDTERMT